MAAVEKHTGTERPPERPLLLFDGDCGFCRFWVARWRAATRGQVDFAPAQQEAARFPQIAKESWKRSVQLVTPKGEVYGGAEAVFRTLAYAPERRWMLGFYRRVPGAQFVSEAAYRLVERHRGFFSWLTRLGWGRDPEPPSYVLSRWFFLRLLGLRLRDRLCLAVGAISRFGGRARNSSGRQFSAGRAARLTAQTPTISSRRLPGSTRAMPGSSSCAAPERWLGCWWSSEL